MNNTNIHGDYHNALEKIDHLELMNVNIAQEHDERIAAMGCDMGNVIHRYKRLKRKYRRRKKYPRSKLLQSGDGLNRRKLIQYLKNKYQAGNGIRHKGLKYFVNKARKARYLTPTTVSVCNNGEVQWKGEEGYQRGCGIFRSGEILQRNLGIGGMLRSRN